MPESVNSVILKVAEAYQQDIGLGRARLDSKSRAELGVEFGTIVELQSKKVTGAKVFKAMHEDEGKGLIRIDALVRRNAGVSVGDKIIIRKAKVQDAEQVILAPVLQRDDQRIRFGPGLEKVIRRGLLTRPITKGDTIIIQGIALLGTTLPFMVVNSSPKGTLQITETTNIIIKEEPVKELEVIGKQVAYEDIGGLKEELQRIREMIELPLKHPELFTRLGISPPKGVLLFGPPGTGKTLIAKAVANESGANFYSIQGPEIMSKFYGQSEERLREIFEEASQRTPSIIFIDELDSIAPKRDEVSGEVERRVVAQLLTLMDGLSSRVNVIVIGATNREDAIDPALRRPGRFDREIEIGVPTRNGRKEILQIHTRGMPFEGGDTEKELLLDEFADLTHGFVGADLAALSREAAMRALRRYLPEIDLDKPIPSELLEKMNVTKDDFKNALRDIEPSSLREVSIDIPTVRWDDIGGLDNIKKILIESVEKPIKDADSFKRMGIKPPRGILLYGAPGTGKTLLAKAIATESQANFISIKGPEIMSKWVGESEKAIRQIFKKAKQAAPCIIFLDEIDSIAPKRGLYSDSGATERVVNQLLTSIDGMESLNEIVIIGATNRPDILDNALLRPGRFDRLIYVPPPDEKTRLQILKVHTRDMPLSKEVSLQTIGSKTDSYVGADIEALCREAALLALRENPDAKTVLMAHFEKALTVVKPSVDPTIIKSYEEWSKSIAQSIIRKKSEEPVYYH